MRPTRVVSTPISPLPSEHKLGPNGRLRNLTEGTYPAPRLGDDVYIPSSLYLTHGADDFRGGLCRIVAIHEHDTGPFVEAEEDPGAQHNWRLPDGAPGGVARAVRLPSWPSRPRLPPGVQLVVVADGRAPARVSERGVDGVREDDEEPLPLFVT